MREGQTFVFAGPSQELEVERLVHETFSRAFAHRARMAYDGITPYAGYLCRVARNFMITEARAAKHAPMLTHSGELPDLESLQPSPEETAQTEQLVTLAREFLTTRPEDERQVFDARFRHSESQEMAARRLGVSRMVVRRAEARLKAAFVAFLGERNALEQTGGGAGVSHEA